MHDHKLMIRALEQRDIAAVAGFPPPEWSFAFEPFLQLHLGAPYFHPIAATIDGRIVGVGNAMVNGTVAWLGNIIVPPAERGRGIGSRVTAELIRLSREQGCTTLLLIATEMGEPLYRKLGFETTGLYRFYRGEPAGGALPSPRLRRLRSEDQAAVLALDGLASGESRGPLLARFFEAAWVHEHDGGMDGFYLPGLGAGLVVAANDDAGIELLRLRLRDGHATIVVPDGNAAAKRWLVTNGYGETTSAPRMCLGPEVAWRADLVFSRGAGYCG